MRQHRAILAAGDVRYLNTAHWEEGFSHLQTFVASIGRAEMSALTATNAMLSALRSTFGFYGGK